MQKQERGGRPNFEPSPLIDFIKSHSEVIGCAPTLDEIASEFGISKCAAWHRIKLACQSGLLQKRRYGPRSIKVVEE